MSVCVSVRVCMNVSVCMSVRVCMNVSVCVSSSSLNNHAAYTRTGLMRHRKKQNQQNIIRPCPAVPITFCLIN